MQTYVRGLSRSREFFSPVCRCASHVPNVVQIGAGAQVTCQCHVPSYVPSEQCHVLTHVRSGVNERLGLLWGTAQSRLLSFSSFLKEASGGTHMA